jgi:hypothetical protein
MKQMTQIVFDLIFSDRLDPRHLRLKHRGGA